MKYIDKKNLLKAAHDITDNYLFEECRIDDGDGFYHYQNVDYNGSFAYSHAKEKMQHLILDNQENYCCYCMRDLHFQNQRVTLEHIIPQSCGADKFSWYMKLGVNNLASDRVVRTNDFTAVENVEIPPRPHTVTFENLVASCDGTFPDKDGTSQCCNNRRGEKDVYPMFYVIDVGTKISYTEDGTMLPNTLCERQDDYRKTIDNVRLNCQNLKDIRRLWHLFGDEDYANLVACLYDKNKRNKLLSDVLFRNERLMLQDAIILNKFMRDALADFPALSLVSSKIVDFMASFTRDGIMNTTDRSVSPLAIWEAYCDIKLRNIFKNEYLTAQGIALTKAQDIMSKFKVYIDRFNGIPDILEIRRVASVEDMIQRLDHIFTNKWQNHIKDSFRMMPQVFAQYGRFLQAENARSIKPIIQDTPQSVVSVSQMPVPLSDYEKPYIDKEGKLQIIANPLLITLLKKYLTENIFGLQQADVIACKFYGQQFASMTATDWQTLVDKLFAKDKKKEVSKTGVKKTKIHLVMTGIVDEVMQPLDAILMVCNHIGKDKVAKLRFEVKGMPFMTRYALLGKEKYYVKTDDGWFINTYGTTDEKARILRLMASHFRIPLRAEVVR